MHPPGERERRGVSIRPPGTGLCLSMCQRDSRGHQNEINEYGRCLMKDRAGSLTECCLH